MVSEGVVRTGYVILCIVECDEIEPLGPIIHFSACGEFAVTCLKLMKPLTHICTFMNEVMSPV